MSKFSFDRPEKIALVILISCWIFAYIASTGVFAQTPVSNFQRIRQDDNIIVWKFQDGVADCYVASTIYLNNTRSSSPSIACVKR